MDVPRFSEEDLLALAGLTDSPLSQGGSYDARDYVIQPTPEPASLTLLGLGALGMAGYGWRRRRLLATA